MKKYVKPALFCERFKLTEIIAGNCDIICNSQSGSCDSQRDSTTYGPFTSGDQYCAPKLSIDGDISKIMEGYCYWNGGKDGYIQLFTS